MEFGILSVESVVVFSATKWGLFLWDNYCDGLIWWIFGFCYRLVLAEHFVLVLFLSEFGIYLIGGAKFQNLLIHTELCWVVI